MTDDRARAGDPDFDWGAGDLPLSEERRAYLAPRLRALMADFAKLEAGESPELEPATTVRPWAGDDDGSR
jgi:hypothetical protein